MKKNVLLLMLAVLGALHLSAQKDTSRQMSFGGEIGPNLSGGIFLKNPDSSPKGSPGVGFQLGLVADFPLNNPSYSFRPRLQFARESFTNKVYGEDFPIHVSMIKLPLDFIYHPAGDGTWIFGAGPYVAMGVGGKFGFNGYTAPLHFGSDSTNDQGKRFDVGLDLLAGYKVTPNIYISADLNFGFVNVMNDAYWGSGVSGHTLNFGITAVYMLSPKN